MSIILSEEWLDLKFTPQINGGSINITVKESYASPTYRRLSRLTDLINSSPCFCQEGLSIAYPSLTFENNDPTILPTGLNLPGSILPFSSSISLRMWIYLTEARKSVVVTIDVFGSLMSTHSSNLIQRPLVSYGVAPFRKNKPRIPY